MRGQRAATRREASASTEDQKKEKEITKELREYVKNNVDLYVKNIKPEFLTLGQFAHIMTQVSASQFVNKDMINASKDAYKEKREPELEL